MRALATYGAFARRSSDPMNSVPPVLGGDLYAGGSPAITPGTWSGSPSLTYSLEVDGVEVESGDQATVEAYVFTLGDEGFTAELFEIPNGDTGSAVASNAETVDLAAKIIALFAAVSWTVLGLFLARRKALDVQVVSDTHVETWANWGTGSDATQATDAARFTWSDTAINGLPAVTADGNDTCPTANLDSTGATAYSLASLFQDSVTAFHVPAEYGDVAGSGIALRINDSAGAGSVGVQTRITQSSRAQSVATSYPMTSPGVVTGTWDTALTSNETEIRHDGSNVTDSRPVNGNNSAGAVSSQPLTLGSRVGGANPTTGAIAVTCLAYGATAIPTTTLSDVAGIVRAAWGLS